MSWDLIKNPTILGDFKNFPDLSSLWGDQYSEFLHPDSKCYQVIQHSIHPSFLRVLSSFSIVVGLTIT
jgi:hypothetical protein